MGAPPSSRTRWQNDTRPPALFKSSRLGLARLRNPVRCETTQIMAFKRVEFAEDLMDESRRRERLTTEVEMRHRLLTSLGVFTVVIAVGSSAPAASQAPKSVAKGTKPATNITWTPASRTPDGQPDLQGFWNF